MPIISCTDPQCLVAITAECRCSEREADAVRDERLRWLAADASPVLSVEISAASSGLIDFLATLSTALLCDRLSMMEVCLRGIVDAVCLDADAVAVSVCVCLPRKS